MLEKLRVKFIALNVVIAALVLVAAFASIGFLTHQGDVSRLYAALDAKVLHVVNDDVRHQSDAPPIIGSYAEDRGPITPIAVYRISTTGSYTLEYSYSSALIPADTAKAAAAAMETAPDGEGFLEGLALYYSKRSIDAGCIVAFADESAVAPWQSLALTLAIVGGVTFALLVAIGIAFSRRAMRPVERAWHLQQQFVADASHELKTPLSVIVANNAILAAHPASHVADQMRWIESTRIETRRMQGLIDDMLELARLDDAKSPDVPDVPFDFSDAVEKRILQFESVAYDHGVEITSSIRPDVFVRGDGERLGRIVSTLLDNACKYASRGGRVNVTLELTKGSAVLSVHNDGTTIPQEEIPRVFDRFYRADKARSSDAGGSGLGLSIAQKIIERHRGTIAASSSPVRGTTFTVTLPASDEASSCPSSPSNPRVLAEPPQL